MPRGKGKKRNPQGPATPPESIAGHLVDQRRRGFLTAAIAGGAGVGLASLIGTDEARAQSASTDNKSASYRETDHIREAYRRMRF